MKKLIFSGFFIFILFFLTASLVNAADCAFDSDITTFLSRYESNTICDNENGVNIYLKVCAKETDLNDLRSSIFLPSEITLKQGPQAQGPVDLTQPNCYTFQWIILCSQGSDTSEIDFDVTYTNSLTGITKSCSLNYETELNTDFECSIDSDCGTNEWLNNNYCQDGNVWDIFRTYQCVLGFCDYTDAHQQKTICGYGCSEGACVEAPPSCAVPTDCGTDGWLNNNYCGVDDNVWDTYRTYTCIANVCGYFDSDLLKQECSSTETCSNGVCVTSSNGGGGSGGGSGGGGTTIPYYPGGGGSSVPSEILLNFTAENPITRYASNYDKYCFYYEDEFFCFKVRMVTRNSVDYIIHPINLEGVVILGTRADISLNDNPLTDLYVWYESYDSVNNVAKLTFKLINYPERRPVEPATSEPEPAKELQLLDGLLSVFSRDSEKGLEKGAVSVKTGIFISITVLISGLLVYFIFSRRKY